MLNFQGQILTTFLKMAFSFEQQVFAISVLVTTENSSESKRQFVKKYGSPAPDDKTIVRWRDKLYATGSLCTNQKGQGRPVTASGNQNSEKVIASITEECAPHLCVAYLPL